MDPWQISSDTSGSDIYHNDTKASILFSCGINLALFTLALLVFAALLRFDGPLQRLAPHLQAPRPSFPFGWIKLAISKPCSLDVYSLDALVLIRFCDLGLKFSMCAGLICMGLVPMYANSGCGIKEFSKYSLSNLYCSSHQVWAVVLAAYAMNIVLARLMHVECREFRALRGAYYHKAANGDFGPGAAQALRSLLLDDVPKKMRSAASLHSFFESVFGSGKVHSAVLQSDTAKLHRLGVLKRCARWFTSAATHDRLHAEVTNLRESVRVTADVCTGVQMQPMTFASLRNKRRTTIDVDQQSLLEGASQATAALDLSRDARAQAQQECHEPKPASTPVGSTSTAYVTLMSVKDRVIAEQLVLSHRNVFTVQQAPEARDILWGNATVELKWTRVRNIVAVVLCCFMLLFWSVPVSFIQAWSNLASLKERLPEWAVDFLQSLSPWLLNLLVKYLPVLMLMLLLTVLPYVFQHMAERFEKHKVKSQIHRIVLNRYFGYLMATLYVTVLSGSVMDSLEQILEHPASTLDLLRKTVPGGAAYFITFVLARTGISLPLLLLWPVLCPCFKSTVHCYFPTEAADPTLVLVLGMTYSAIAPWILPACALYFGVAAVVYRWLFLYTYTPEFESAGAFWYDLFNSTMLGLLLADVSLMALVGSYSGLESMNFYASAVLPVAVLCFKEWCRRKYVLPSMHMALDDTAEVKEDVPCLDENYYMDPVLGLSETTNVQGADDPVQASSETTG